MPALSRLQLLAQQLAQSLPAYVHATDATRRLRQHAEPRNAEGSPLALREALTVRDVSFAYPAAPDRFVLSNVNLRIPAGGFVAVMGPTGAGKSTLADLLLGLLEPGEGAIRVDGSPLTGANARRWRRSVAYVPQETYLFHESLRDNMRRAEPRATESEIRGALDLAAAGELIDTLPQGLDTVVGDRGSRLSGGERQRIALAQALLRKPALFVLDEATGHLDARSEEHVLATLASRPAGMTVVAMTHRPAPARHADRVVLLEAGQVSAVRRWSELAPELTTAGAPPPPDARAAPS